MTERMYIHIGPYKTGTTYVQGLLTVNQERLREQGMLFPGGSFRAQGRAVREILRRGAMPTTGRTVEGEWQKLRIEIREWEGPAAVLSHELLATALPGEVARVCRAFKRLDVHVVFTARDLTRVAPAMWQTGLRSKRVFTWEEYVQSLREPQGDFGPWGKKFWQCEDAAAVLKRWRKHLPLENLNVVTVPRPGNPPELLWQRFCAAVGIDPAGLDLEAPRSNPSLGAAESELVRRVNVAMETTEIQASQWLYWVRWLGRALETRAEIQKFTMPVADIAWMTDRAQHVIAGLRAGGYPVIGDFDDLLPEAVTVDKAHHPSDTTDAAVLEVAVDSIRRLLVELGPPQLEDSEQ